MEIDVSKIISDKLAQMDNEGVIKKRIEDTVEKVVLDAFTSSIDTWEFKNAIRDQVKASVSTLAVDCGMSAYNGFIVSHVRELMSGVLSADLQNKMQTAVDDILVQRYENVKLSDLFNKYRTWVKEYVSPEDQYERESFTCHLDMHESCYGSGFTHYTCVFSENPGCLLDDDADVVVKISQYKNNSSDISKLKINGDFIDGKLSIGPMSEFERFLVNLYFNKTPIIMDWENVDEDDNLFDIEN